MNYFDLLLRGILVVLISVTTCFVIMKHSLPKPAPPQSIMVIDIPKIIETRVKAGHLSAREKEQFAVQLMNKIKKLSDKGVVFIKTDAVFRAPKKDYFVFDKTRAKHHDQ